MKPYARLISGCIGLCIAGACTRAVPPQVSDAHTRAAELSDTGAPNDAAETWQRSQETLARADAAAREGDTEAAIHFAALAQIQLETVEAEAEGITLQTRARKLKAEQQQLMTEITSLEQRIEAAEQAQEQARLRAHVVAVAAESRREAAAAEAYRARFKGEQSERARRAVAGQYLERAMLFSEIVDGYVSLGFVAQAEAAVLEPSRTALAAAFSEGDLFAVEDRSGILIAAAHRLMETAWTGTKKTFSEANGRLAEALDAAHIAFTREDFGLWIDLGEARRSRKRETPPALFSRLRSILETAPALIVVLSAAPKEKAPASARKKSREQALRQAAQLVVSGLDSDRIRSRGCAELAPVPSLAEGKSPSALFLVPVPATKSK